MTWSPTISTGLAELREMLIRYLTDQLIRSSTRPTWYGDHIPDGKRFEYLVDRYYRKCQHEPTADYQRYLCSRHWRIFRLAVMIAANGRCAICNKPADDVHHLTYERVEKELLSDVAPLCRGCHEQQHEDRIKRSEERKR